MTELEKIKRAKMYMDKLANGINPIDDSVLPDDNIINNVRLLRCFDLLTISALAQRAQRIITHFSRVIALHGFFNRALDESGGGLALLACVRLNNSTFALGHTQTHLVCFYFLPFDSCTFSFAFQFYTIIKGIIGAELSSLCHICRRCVGLRSAQRFYNFAF